MKYQEYLQSEQWKQLRKAARKRAGNQCEMCGGPADHVHHVYYPKRFKDDHLDNLVVVCEYHHKLIHGIRAEVEMAKQLQTFVFDSGSAQYKITPIADDNGVEWFYLDELARIFAHEGGRRPQSGEFLLTNDFTQLWFRLDEDERAMIGNRRAVTEPGMWGILMTTRSSLGQRLRRWLKHEVLPILRKGGAVGPALQSTNGASVHDEMIKQAELLLWNMQEVKRLNQQQTEIDGKVRRLSANVDNCVEQIRQLSGGDYYRTARLRMMEHGLKPDQSTVMMVGQRCRARCLDAGEALPPKIAEGTYMVNQYPIEILDSVLSEMRLIH